MELQVVKNVASQTLEVKKLVYLYLLHYAEKYGIFRLLVSGHKYLSLLFHLE